MLQADITMQQLAEESELAGQLASVRFLAGVIYELNDEYDDALISLPACIQHHARAQRSYPDSA